MVILEFYMILFIFLEKTMISLFVFSYDHSCLEEGVQGLVTYKKKGSRAVINSACRSLYACPICSRPANHDINY